jgi:hypothetical protein
MLNIQISKVKIIVTVPASHSDVVRQAVGDTLLAGKYDNYSHCSFTLRGIGRFTPLENSNSFIGNANISEEIEEDKIEFGDIKIDNINVIIEAIKSVHPYEQITYDVIPLLDY